MICHRRFTDYQVDNFAECLEKKCSLWDGNQEMCGDVVQILLLDKIVRTLEAISRTLYEKR